MCHEYGMRWWKSDKTTSARTEDAKPEAKAMIAALYDERAAKPAPQKQVEKQAEEKELVPAE